MGPILALQVTNIEFRPGGLGVIFSDGSSATAFLRINTGKLELEGLTTDQKAALSSITIDSSVYCDPRFGAIGLMFELKDDTSPQLGGFLDLNGYNIYDDNGTARGLDAFDFQLSRSNANQVASGNYSFIAGGFDNTAAGYASFAANADNWAEGDFSSAFGYQSYASLYGQQAIASGAFSTYGDAQHTTTIMRAEVADEEWNELSIDGSGSHYYVLAEDKHCLVDISILARRVEDQESAAFRRLVIASNDSGTVAVENVQTVGTDLNPGDNFDIEITGHLDRIKVAVKALVGTSASGTHSTVRWVASLKATEVGTSSIETS